jgi:hypothetical protein
MFISPLSQCYRDAGSGDSPILRPWQIAAAAMGTAILHEKASDIPSSGIKDRLSDIEHASDRIEKPRFEESFNYGGRLLFRDLCVGRIKGGSTSLCCALKSFEDQGWPSVIDNPIGDDESGRDFVRKMNKNQRGPTRIEFTSPRSGRQIAWRLVDVNSPSNRR